MFQFASMNVCICTFISWYFNNIDQIAFSELEKIFSNDFALFLWSDCGGIKKQLQRYEDWKFPWYILDISKLSWVKAYKISCLFNLLQYTPLLKD